MFTSIRKKLKPKSEGEYRENPEAHNLHEESEAHFDNLNPFFLGTAALAVSLYYKPYNIQKIFQKSSKNIQKILEKSCIFFSIFSKIFEKVMKKIHLFPKII